MSERATYIGGSDAAAIAGLSSRRTRYETYFLKTGEVEEEEYNNQSIWLGNTFEDTVRKVYEQQSGNKTLLLHDDKGAQRLIRNAKHPFIGGHIDAVIVPEGKSVHGNQELWRDDPTGWPLLEVKTANVTQRDRWGEPGTDEVPQEYLVQVYHYMLVLDAPWADLAVFFWDNFAPKFEVYHIERDEEALEGLLELEVEFWNDVQSRNEPEPDVDPAVVHSVAKRRYKGTDGSTVDMPEELLEIHVAYLEAKENELAAKHAYDEAKAQREAFEAPLLNAMQNSAIMRIGDGGYTRTVVDAKQISYLRKPYTLFKFKDTL